MDTTQHEWRALPKWEQELKQYYEDTKGDRLLMRNDGGGGEITYKYFTGKRPKESDQKIFWKKFSEEAMREEAGGWRARAKGLRKNTEKKAFMKKLHNREDERMDRKRRYTHHSHTAKETNENLQREIFDTNNSRNTTKPLFQQKKKRRRFDDRGGTGTEPIPPNTFSTPGIIRFELSEGEAEDANNNDTEHKTRKKISASEKELKTQETHLTHTRNHPNDATAWTAYSRYQEKVGSLTKKSRYERQVSILETAIASNPDSEILWLELAGIVQKNMGVAEAELTWDTALRSTHGSLPVWDSFLNWKKSCFQTFTVPSYRKMLQQSLMSPQHTMRTTLEALHTAAAFEKSSGYPERGIAIYQALLLLALTPESTVESLETYWEQEAPRPGEEGYTPGMFKTEEDEEEEEDDEDDEANHTPPPPVRLDSARLLGLSETVHPKNTYREWLNLHRSREKVQVLPLRVTVDDDDVELDPDRAVLFEDLEGYLAVFKTTPIREHVDTLLHNYLEFLGLPVRYTQHGVVTTSTGITNEALSTIFNVEGWKEAFDWTPGTAPLHSFKLLTLVRGVLRLGMQVLPDDQLFPLMSYYVEKRMDPNKALNLCKDMLAARDTHTGLWLKYAQDTPNKKISEKIFKKLLSAGGDLSVCRARVEELLLQNEVEAARDTLCRVAGGSATSDSAGILRTVAKLNASSHPDAVGCQALLHHTTGNSHKGLALLESVVENNQNTYLWMLLCRYTAIVGSAFDPGTHGRVLKKAALANASHPLFIYLYVQNQLRFGTKFSIRRFFGEAVEVGSDVTWYYAGLVEGTVLENPNGVERWLQRGVRAESGKASCLLWTEYLLRTTYDRVLKNPSWEAIQTLKAEVSSAKTHSARKELANTISKSEKNLRTCTSVFYQAVSTVPWCLNIWTEGLGLIFPSFSSDEIQDVVDLILERELHLRAYVEEVAVLQEGPVRPTKLQGHIDGDDEEKAKQRKLQSDYVKSRVEEDRKRIVSKAV